MRGKKVKGIRKEMKKMGMEWKTNKNYYRKLKKSCV